MKQLLPLAFAFLATSAFAQVQFYGPSAPSTGGVTAQDFETAYDIYDALGADDFVVPSGVTWYIDSIVIPGSYSATATTTCGLAYNIHSDNSGQPGTQLFGDTINANLDGNGDGDLTLVFETPAQLTSGHYWLVANGRKNFGSGGGQWYWQRDSNAIGYPALWQNPGNGFGSTCTTWTTFYDCTALGMSDSGLTFYIYGCYGPNKPIGVGFDTLLCAGQTGGVTLVGDTIGSQSNVSYLWSTGATTQDITVTGSGTFTLYAVDSVTQCGRAAEYTVGIGSVPTPDIEDQSICATDVTGALFGPINVTGCPECIVVWGDGSTGPFYSTSTGGMVTVTILDTVSGCSSSDTASVTVFPAVADIVPDGIIDLCEGSTVTVSVQQTLSSYDWWFTADGTNWSSLGTNSTADVDDGGKVAVSGVDGDGCDVFDTADVILRPLPNVDITATALTNGNVQLDVTSGYVGYLWDDGSIGETLVVTENGIYTVTVTDEFGCEGTAFFNVFNVGIEDPIARQVDIYPNPTQGAVQVAWPSEWVGNASLSVIDLQGRTIMNTTSNEQLQTLDLSGLAPGHYVLQITSPEGVGKTALVIAR